ncbi:hypothetical protein FHS72_001753 [Loktanella ponticola]|uniref:Uncharacterized protein n=1 Tax=Yoonia ponticola TaxID=1524255 RepID=A0A7W9BL72_9RHOB|nr:hypothetical protein [Yoonia ponticola]MBB5722129.1 hypothetical protein [Yoonia ponticola]
MSDQKKPNETNDDDKHKENGKPGAFGNEDDAPAGTSGVSGTRRGPERINPSEDVDK